MSSAAAGPGVAVIAGQSRIRFVVVHGANVRRMLGDLNAWLRSLEGELTDWPQFISHGFYGVTVEIHEAGSGWDALTAARAEVARLNKIKPGCARLWPTSA